MLEWKTIKLQNHSFIGMHMVLPKQGIYIISSTHCILVGNMFEIDKLSPNSCVFVMEKADSFQNLLESKVKAMNEKAKRSGYHLTMNGKEVLLYQDTSNKIKNSL